MAQAAASLAGNWVPLLSATNLQNTTGITERTSGRTPLDAGVGIGSLCFSTITSDKRARAEANLVLRIRGHLNKSLYPCSLRARYIADT